MDSKGILTLDDVKYQNWIEEMNSRIMDLGFDVWHQVCNVYTKTPPLAQDLQNNMKEINEIFCNIPHSVLEIVMHYQNTKEVWDNMQVIHKGEGKHDCSSSKKTCNLFYKRNNGVS